MDNVPLRVDERYVISRVIQWHREDAHGDHAGGAGSNGFRKERICFRRGRGASSC
jgi:hypothetical protein